MTGLATPARTRLGIALAVALYVALAAWGLHTDRYLHDEGLLSHLFAAVTARSPAAALFFQKSRPPLAALYAPVAALGLGPFLVAHVAVGALAVVGVGRIARALGHREPAVASLAVAVSPLMVGGAAAGVSNTDAVVGIVLFGELFVVQRRPVLACIVLGALVWVRAELAVLVALVIGAMVRERRGRALAGIAAFGLVYGAAGAVYHGDALWMVRYPPTLPDGMPGNPYWETHAGAADLPMVVGALLAITPTLVLLAAVRVRDLTRFERLGLAFAVALCSLLLLLPRWRVFNFDLSPRYLLPILPFVALAVSRVTEVLRDPTTVPRAVTTVVLFGLAAIAIANTRLGAHGGAVVAVGLAALAVTASRISRPRWVLGLVVALAALGPVALADGARLDRHHESPHLPALVDALEHHGDGQTRRVYTNEPLLCVYLARTGRLPWADVRYLVQADQRFELDRLANHDNGQRDALVAALEHDFYGTPVFPGDLDPNDLPPGTLFALTRDPRLSLVLPTEQWDPHLTIVHAGRRAYVAALRPEPRRRSP